MSKLIVCRALRAMLHTSEQTDHVPHSAQEEEEMAATKLELGGMAAPSEVRSKHLFSIASHGQAVSDPGNKCDCGLQGSLWTLVQRTQAHSRHAELYTLPAFEDGWQRRR